MKNRSRYLSLLLVIALLLSLFGCTAQEPTPSLPAEDLTVTILYTNDVHGYMNNDKPAEGEQAGLSYAHLSALKKDLTAKGENVFVVDAGDHVQGTVYTALDQGLTALNLMNGIYDLATIGNHEFDYGMERALALTKNAQYPYISCNFVDKASGKPVLDPHKLVNIGGMNVGFVGITTPEAITSAAPSYFQDKDGKFIYDILAGDKLYAAVQKSVDALKADGAEVIIGLAHLGVDAGSQYTSKVVIANVSGLDAVIDGHSHTEVEKEFVKDKAGNDVLLTQTGYYFGAIGKMTIGKDGIDTVLIKTYATADEQVTKTKDNWVATVNTQLGEKIGALAAPLRTNDDSGKRLVRVSQTNLGDFVADSYYYYVNEVDKRGCDIALINGGGLRADVPAGDISYMELKATNPFGNALCIVELTGQQILDALEWGARLTTGTAGENETGAFLHTAGLTYTVDTAINSTVQKTEQDIWSGAPTGDYRVKDVKVYDKKTKGYVALDRKKTYAVASINYILRSKGDGFEMLGGKLVKDYIIEDYMALATYAKAFADTDKDGLADITAANSPLAAYTGYTMDYAALDGAKRVTLSVAQPDTDEK